MDLTIRPATLAGHAAFEALHRAAQAVHHRGWPEVFRAPEVFGVPQAEYAATISRPGTFVRVACRGDEVVGYLHAALLTRPEDACRKAQRVLYVNNLAVRSDVRRQGVGAALADDALALAREAGAVRVELDVYSFNTEARAFYAGRGFRPQIERLALELPTSAPRD